MKKLVALFFTLLVLMTGVRADEGQEITDEDLWKYALLNEVIDQMKKDISTAVNEMIANQDGIDGKRYVELAKTKGDEAKLTELGATDLEKQFLQLVDEEKEKRIDAIKTVNQELATKMVGDGGRTYKAIKAALEEDASLQSRYDAILAKVQMAE